MASQPFTKISDQEIENLEGAIFQRKRKKPQKYGMKNFNGNMHVYIHLTYNFV